MSMGQDTSLGERTAAEPSGRVAGILDAACRVIVREGAHGLRMASVAAEAGVSKALVHYYFSTRHELLRSAFAWSEDRWHAALSAELASLPTGAERLAHALCSSVDSDPRFSDQRALWNEVWSSLRFDDGLRPQVEQSYRRWLDLLVALLEEGKADGSIPADVDAASAGWRLAAAGDGLDSLLYLGLIDRDRGRDLMLGSIRRELSPA
jgi:AcrR family transcriptional regulator